MKTRTLTLLALSCFWTSVSFAQSFANKDKVLSLGIGIGSSLGSFDHNSQIPALSLMYEQGIAEVKNAGVISLGGYIGYKSFGYQTTVGGFTSKTRWNYTIIGARGAFHFTQVPNEKLDLYGGLLLSYNILNYSYETNNGYSDAFSSNFGNSGGLTLFGRARYYFSDKFAGLVEIGYGIAYLNLGLSAKL